jgi:hypothetical protein
VGFIWPIDVDGTIAAIVYQAAAGSKTGPDVRPFVVTVLSPEHLLAEKVCALLVWAKPRDLYAAWLLRGQGIRLDGDLIGKKLKLEETSLTLAVVEAALTHARTDWERSLRPQPDRWQKTPETPVSLRRLALACNAGSEVCNRLGRTGRDEGRGNAADSLPVACEDAGDAGGQGDDLKVRRDCYKCASDLYAYRTPPAAMLRDFAR